MTLSDPKSLVTSNYPYVYVFGFLQCHIPGTTEARVFKFCTVIDHIEY